MYGLFVWKTKKRHSNYKAFQKILDESNHKPNKIWVDKGSEFYNRSMKSWLEKKKTIEMCSIHNEGQSAVAEIFIRTLKNNMTSRSKNVYIDTLDYTVNKYNNTYHRTIKMKPVDVKSSIYADFNKESNKEGPKFKVHDNVRVSKYKNIFAKDYVPNWSEDVFVIKKCKNIVPWTYVANILYEKELQKTNQKEYRIEKAIKRKDDKLYV